MKRVNLMILMAATAVKHPTSLNGPCPEIRF